MEKQPRNRSRYAPDHQVERAAELALRLGVRLKLYADGSVEILGRLDASKPTSDALTLYERECGIEETPDEALERWRRENFPADRAIADVRAAYASQPPRQRRRKK